jgi:hypothetical protein
MDKFPKMRLMMVGNTGGWRNFMTTKTQIKEPSDVKGQKNSDYSCRHTEGNGKDAWW